MENAKENKEGKRNGLITTIVVHACLLVLCLFLGFTYMTPPEGVMEIGIDAFGAETAGSTEELATSEKVAETSEEVQETPAQSQDNPTEENFETQEESPVDVAQNTNTTKKQTSKNTEETESTETTEKPREIDPRFKDLASKIKGEDNPGGKGAGGDGPGEGDLTGTKKGAPGGSGGMFDLGGRKATKPGQLNHDCKRRASVDVRVVVSRSGVVKSAVVTGGTNLNKCIEDKAVAAAKSTIYSAKTDGPELQEGTITLEFHVN